MDTSFIDVSSGTAAPLSSIVDEIAHEAGEEESTDSFDARPGIDRREEETNARILTSDAPVNGYTCFLSLSDRVQREKGDFFLQPHSTQIVWGGRKVIFIFQHHSGRFGLYYDILCPGLVGAASGGWPEGYIDYYREGSHIRSDSRGNCERFPAERRRTETIGGPV